MAGHKYSVEFRVFSETLDPAQISRELGLQPCQMRMKGQRVGRKPNKEGMWAYNGGRESAEWDSLSEGLSFVLKKLWPHRKTIAGYGANGKFIWWCGHFQSSFDGGPSLSAPLLKKLGEFGAELYLDNYFSEK